MRDTVVKVRMTDAERGRLVLLAHDQETTISEVVRRLVKEAAELAAKEARR